MDMMGESASNMNFRLFSMTDGKDIPVFYVDAAAINAKISNASKNIETTGMSTLLVVQ